MTTIAYRKGVLIETLQARIAELEKQNTELRRDCARYENGRVILAHMIDSLTERLREAHRPTDTTCP